MSLDIIKNLFITISFTIILFISASSFYMVRSNYSDVDGTVEQSDCVSITNSKLYSCNLTVSYLVNKNKITNQIVINSEKKYKEGDIVSMEYDTNNYLNVSFKTEYKQTALVSSVCGLIFLIMSIIIYDGIRQNIIQKINNILNYMSFLT